jgi:lipopolysaccharide transport system ATP-binding protein
MTPAIRVRGLGKRYQLGERVAYGALRDAIAGAVTWPLRVLRGGRRRQGSVRDWIWALDDLSFDVGQGEVVGVVGRNGSGKSTLLKILSRITEPTTGRAEIRGRVGSLLEVGTGFHPELTGRENIFVNGAILGMGRVEIDRKFDEIVGFAGVDRFVDTPVKFYSSGMQMRLAFAVAAHLEPEILLVDEVLAVGDLSFQQKCLGKLDAVSRSGRTVLFVSHQMNQLRRLCGRTLWLDGGRLVEIGDTADVINHYEASFMRVATDADGARQRAGTTFLTWTLGVGDEPEHALTTFGPVVVRFLLQVEEPIRNGHHGLALYDREGRVMWGAGTDNLELDPGTYEIAYRLDALPLKPGPYRWHVSIFNNGRFVNNLDCIPELSVQTPPLGHRRDEFAGVLNVPFTVDFRPATREAASPEAPAALTRAGDRPVPSGR